ncbi:M13 family metallopeptidase [Sphingomonas sp. S1-29]|uniref:M13 family metallopeptidase n=1 Tax=Sphingomonas sp. S1-29 TaxID=2991074 RepID=UPI00223F5702|nr:M13 family metallopeptidase [Sphingomonas sp. S1-29]UZK70075.1 M13 family metallopeptidase [Sphingomonas sp. S1-29]
MRITALSAALLAGAATLAGCATTTASAPDTAAAQSPAAQPAAAPRYGAFGFDAAGMDQSVAPGDDFYEYANGGWGKATPIPADKSNYGLFNVLDDQAREQTRAILEEQKGIAGSKIGTAYATYLDQAAIDAKGLAPIQPWLTKIKTVRDKPGYAALVAEAQRNGVDGPIGTYVGIDDKNPTSYAVNMGQSGLGMPDRDYYLSADAKQVETRAAYLAYLTKLLTLAGEANPAQRAAAILAFETGIARVHWTRTESRDSEKTYNKTSLADLARTAPGFDFARYLQAAGTPVDTLIVAQPSAIAGTAKLIAATPIQVLQDQLIVRSLENFSGSLPSEIDRTVFAFTGTTLAGTPEQEPRWKRAVNFTNRALSDEVSKLYVDRHFPASTKAAADELVKNVIVAFDKRIDKLDWMDPATKVKAKAKLAAFTPKIGYPDQWRDYSSLDIRSGDAFGNALRANHWAYQDNISKLGQPIRKWEWGMTPMTVNAYANFGMVEIVFPAAILQPPFFDPNADPAVNYGGIGAVIGHELSHHFDDQGSKYDLEGRLTTWWTPQDVARFKQRSQAVVAQYAAYEGMPGVKVNGELTLGENIADLAGLTMAYDAYQASLGGKPAPVIEGFTGDQRFHLGWAQLWRRNYRDAELRRRLLTDPHSPSEQRVAVVRNLDPWYAAYDVKPGAQLYLAPKDRISIW